MNKFILARLMREGSLLTAQHFEGFFEFDGNDNAYKACALGACLLADDPAWGRRLASLRRNPTNTRVMKFVENTFDTNPIDGKHETLYDIVSELNDWQKWEREAIADWLEGKKREQIQAR